MKMIATAMFLITHTPKSYECNRKPVSACSSLCV